ncbi:hypothetical protein DM01DRAFT_1009675 [Hesseltinella vesiculosa]|uniref:Uncharacterized protein n=1 Tax=Hesseltinella vesiculosa TaxID=101127 RepID=A0A1X2GY82_9FUNG|nr:hypothetical protein DM01DRAFT_1009675 [Hesseltinella vesiculosa]
MISPRNQQILLILHLSVFGRPESMAIASALKQGNSESYKVYYETDLKGCSCSCRPICDRNDRSSEGTFVENMTNQVQNSSALVLPQSR